MNPPATSHPCRTLITALLALLLLGAGAAQADAKAKHGVSASIAHKTLTVTGDRHANKVTLRLKRRASNTLQVDAGSNGSADFSFNRKLFDKIVLRGGSGADTLSIDERNGVFTKNER